MYRIRNFFLFIKRFCYYGYIGASKTYDFDAAGIHTLIHAHMVRVKKFMNSDDTHLMWNDKPDTKGMKRLTEFTELSRIVAYDSHVGPNFNKVCDDYRRDGECFLDRLNDEDYKKDSRIAIKKDQLIYNHQQKRYYYMLEKYVPGFWD